jgi:hypothetical protein
MFIKYAKMHNKLKDADTMVALFSEQAKILIGNPYLVNSAARQVSVAAPV